MKKIMSIFIKDTFRDVSSAARGIGMLPAITQTIYHAGQFRSFLANEINPRRSYWFTFLTELNGAEVTPRQ